MLEEPGENFLMWLGKKKKNRSFSQGLGFQLGECRQPKSGNNIIAGDCKNIHQLNYQQNALSEPIKYVPVTFFEVS